MDYAPVVPASLGTIGLAAIDLNLGTLIVLAVLLFTGAGALIIRNTFRRDLDAFEVAP